MANEDPWTPYALEPLRKALRRRRQGMALGVALALGLAWFVLTATQTSMQQDVLVNGNQGTLDIDAPEREKSGPDATVQVSPGRVVDSNPQVNQGGTEVRRDDQQPVLRADAVNWGGLLLAFGPYLLVGSILWILLRGRGSASDEVNFGIYKGAMPLELITASHRHLVMTGRAADGSLFGKRREDYLPREAFVPTPVVRGGPEARSPTEDVN